MAGNLEANNNNSPSFIKAKTPEELEILMLLNNKKEGKMYDYRDISYVRGFWYAWYFRNQSDKIKQIKKERRRED